MPARFRPNLLCIAPPPFSPTAPPAGAAYLLGFLKAQGCHDFDFLDLRLGVPDAYSPTYTYTGAYAEAFVHDIPDLPLVLQLIKSFDDGGSLLPVHTELFERYALERGISATYLHSYLCSLHRYIADVFAQIPDIRFIGFSVWTTNFLSTLIAAAHLKRRRSPPFVVAGGPQVSSSQASGELALRSGLFDLIAVGEGEQTLLDVYNAFSRVNVVGEDIPGTMYKTAEGAVARNPRPLMRLTTLPPPSFAEMHLSAYQVDNAYRTVPLQFSRGCTDKCEFCSEWKFWERFRTDTAEHTVDQIERVKRDYGATFVIFMDSLLNGIPRRLVELCELLIKRSVDIRWSSFMRAQMDADTAKLLARAGCHDVFIGVESFSDETLALMRKRRTRADNIQALEAFLQAGIDVTAGFIPGFPGDSRENFVASALALRDVLERHGGRFEVHDEAFVVQPGAPIFNKLSDMGLTGRTWAPEYIDIAPAYRDVSSRVLCNVEGPSQGLERVGRLSTLRTVTENALSNSGFVFVRAEGEDLSTMSFDFHHLHGGWHMARRKSKLGHIYGLIVDADEKDDLDSLESVAGNWETAPDAVVAVERLERLHVVPPSRNGLRLIRGLYQRRADDRCTFAVSPFIVARLTDWRNRHRLLIGSILTQQYFQYAPELVTIFRCLLRRPHTEQQIWTACRRQWGHSRTDLAKTLERLKEDGVLVICDVIKRRNNRDIAHFGGMAPTSSGEVKVVVSATGAT
jgi:radical SAM superfamily enzyme YgiQ (UPF0313 family)